MKLSRTVNFVLLESHEQQQQRKGTGAIHRGTNAGRVQQRPPPITAFRRHREKGRGVAETLLTCSLQKTPDRGEEIKKDLPLLKQLESLELQI